MDILKTILLSMFGTLFGGLIGFWLGMVTERHKQILSKIIEEKLQIIPILENTVQKAKVFNSPFTIRVVEMAKVYPIYQRLRVIVRGRKLKHLDATWKTLNDTTAAEMGGSSKTGVFDVNNSEQKQELEHARQILISRLEAFRKAIEKL